MEEDSMADDSKSFLNWPMLCHLGGLATYIGIPFGNIIVPLAIWFFKRGSVPAVREEGRESVNFNLSFTIYGVIAGLMCYILIGFVLLPLVLIAHIVLVIQATLKSNKGESVHYPFTLRIIN
jgi:uncharacterized Tic20 family protein